MSKTICLVDDDPSVRKALSRLLESVGIGVCEFATGEDFLGYAVSHPVSVVVLDIWMERMNGLEMLVHLCSLSPKTRLIIITGRDDFAVRSIASQVGAAFLLKPFEDAEFLDKVENALTDRGGRRRIC